MAGKYPKYPKHPPLLILFQMSKGIQNLRSIDPSLDNGDDWMPTVVPLPSGEVAAFCRKNKLHFARSRLAKAAYEIAANDTKQQMLFMLHYNLVPPMKADLDAAMPKMLAYQRKIEGR